MTAPAIPPADDADAPDAEAPPAVAPAAPLAVRTPVAAAMVGVSRKLLDRERDAGRTPAPLRIGGAVVYRVADLEAWAAWGFPDRRTFEARRAAEADADARRSARRRR